MTMQQGLLDPIPLGVIFILFTVLTFACFEVGFRLGVWWQAREPGEQEGPTDMLVGSLLALMAFVLAITLGLAADRHDARRSLVVEEANAIATAYQRADYLLPPDAEQLKTLLRAYAPLRMVTDTSEVPANITESAELAKQMWAIQTRVAQSGYSPDLMSSVGESLNGIVTVSEQRVVAGIYARVPETIMFVLLAGSALALVMVGYTAGIKGRRSLLSATVLIIALGVVTTLVVDLDRPQEGLLTVSQQALVDVQRAIGSPPP
jgi:MFS family permease